VILTNATAIVRLGCKSFIKIVFPDPDDPATVVIVVAFRLLGLVGLLVVRIAKS
jgi:hypothetical protein